MCKGNIVKTDTHKRFHDYTPNTNSTTSPARVGEVRSNATTKNSRNPTSFLTRRFWWVLPKPKPLKKLGLRPLVETFYIKFQVRMEMVPSCRVMVYYVRKDKEVVADSVELDVEDKLENQVNATPGISYIFNNCANRLPTKYPRMAGSSFSTIRKSSDFVGNIRFVKGFHNCRNFFQNVEFYILFVSIPIGQ